MKLFMKGFVLLMGMVLAAMPSASEITLEHAVIQKAPQTPGGFCPFCVSISVDVNVQNIAFAKDVTLHYSVNDGAWQTSDGFFERSLDDNSEIWAVRTGTGFVPGGVADIEFAIQYEVNGQSYWDNNQGANYALTATSEFADGYIRGNPVIAKNQKVVASRFRGEVLVKNLGFEKEVRIVYTDDNWVTSHVGVASFDYIANSPELEVWGFELNVPMDVESIEFAVAYEVNGTTYWANNYGENYTAKRSSF